MEAAAAAVRDGTLAAIAVVVVSLTVMSTVEAAAAAAAEVVSLLTVLIPNNFASHALISAALFAAFCFCFRFAVCSLVALLR